jgi:hypothetical protein
MPYKTKAEEERESWISGADAIAQVQQKESLDPDAAWKQLRNAIADEIIPVMWDDEFAPLDDEDDVDDDDDIPSNPTTAILVNYDNLDAEMPTNHDSFWRNTLMDHSTGYVLDYHITRPIGDPDYFKGHALKNGGRYRPVLVKRLAFQTFLDLLASDIPLQHSANAATTENEEASTVSLQTPSLVQGDGSRDRPVAITGTGKKKKGPKSARPIIRSTLDEMAKDSSYEFPPIKTDIARQVAKKCKVRLNHAPGWSGRTVVQFISEWLDENPAVWHEKP